MENRITGVMIYYYFVCRRKLWYFCHEIRMEAENEDVILGKILDESSYSKNEKHINIDNIINIDFISEHKELHEKGFIALVVPAMPPAEGVTQLKVETARSGKYLHIKREVLKNILVNVPADAIELPMLFIDEYAFNWFEQQTNQITEE